MVISGPIDLSSVPPVPWKNGGGTTRTLVVHPEGAGLNDFIWRISLAEIHHSSRFSEFPGIERTILLWRGKGVVLRAPGWPDHALTEIYRPFTFGGEEAVTCELLGEPTADLNLMVRRGRVHTMIRAHNDEVRLDDPWDDVVVLCATGRVQILLKNELSFSLDAGQFLRISQVEGGVTILPENSGTNFVCVSVRLMA